MRLEPTSAVLPVQLEPHFNSIKVRLEQILLRPDNGILLFQFHKGAIRTRLRSGLFRFLILFQFHKGAIRTRLHKDRRWRSLYFNSIKVRLERFNLFRSNACLVFQFHKGAIRTLCSCPWDLFGYHFNSIKVRLERNAFICFLILGTEFQFHKGAIRTDGETEASYQKMYFNSIKVRLELNSQTAYIR